MKAFWKYVFPVLFGLLIYCSIRLVTDTNTGEHFWQRSARQNIIEVVSVVVMSFMFDALLRYLLRHFNQRKEAFTLAAVFLEFNILLLVSALFINPVIYLIHYLIKDPVDWADIAIANIVVLLYVLLYYAIGRGNKILHSYIEQKTQIERLKTNSLEAELKFLKAQYHPHFLFNALNTIYFQMDEDVPAAKQTVQTFSELLRYQLYDQQQQVSIQQELHHLQNFIQLQSTRASEKLVLAVTIDPSLQHEKIYPLLFLPLVENAFKYVGGDYRLSIKIWKENQQIHVTVNNSIRNIAPQKNKGIGLENLKRRLELLYPGAHYFNTTASDKEFLAELKIKYLE